MATSMVKQSVCKACNETSGVFFCQGCEKDFCTIHAEEHRQELSKQLDTVILEHDQLKQNIVEYSEKFNQHPLMKEIDQWEMESIDKIRKAADDARKELFAVVDDRRTKIIEGMKGLEQDLSTAQSEDSFVETNLQEWMERLRKWATDLNTSSSINIQQEKNNMPFIRKIIVNIIPKNNEFFERSAGKVRIREQGQIILAQSGEHSTTRCHGEYSSGQHHFRFKVEQMNPLNWIYFGIVSKDIPIQEHSSTTPTTYGWTTRGAMFRNDRGQTLDNSYNKDIIQNDTIELMLDCDRKSIYLTNERTRSKNELEVDVTQCPFPWQLHVGLSFRKDRVRYIPS